MLREGDGDGRRDEQVGAAVILDDAEELGQVELGHRHQARAAAQGDVEEHGHPVDVEERQQRQHPVVALDVEHGPALHDVRDQVGVAELDALGEARRAGRVRQHGEVGGRIEGHLRRRRLLGEQVFERGMPLRPVDDDEVVCDTVNRNSAPESRSWLAISSGV